VLGVSAFHMSGPTPAEIDGKFVETVRAQGHEVPADAQQQALLVRAAQKICERRENHATAAARRATALTTEELDVVGATFADDARAFTSLALKTYCPD